MGQDNRQAPSFGRHRHHHVLQPREVGALAGGQTREVAAKWISRPQLFAPLLQGERGIRNNAVEFRQRVAGVEGGLAQGVATNDLKVLDSMKKKVRAGDTAGRQVLFLAEELAVQHLDFPT